MTVRPHITLSKAAAFAALPPVWPEELSPRIQAASIASPRTLVVLDDDPTGTQTVYDVPVITRWDAPTLESELARGLPCFFVLTNSRSLTAGAARALNLELARNLCQASVATGRAFTLVSRSDSTLRGHFPVETDALAEICGPFDATIIAPYFEAGGRYTVGDIHYVAEGDVLLPAAETPFARDAAFGYRKSNLREWVAEKTSGRIAAAAVHSISIELLRTGGPDAVAAVLLSLSRGSVCVVNLCAPRDADVLAAATLRAEQTGKKFLYRTAASFVNARLGLPPRPLLTGSDLATKTSGGGLVIVGSYVPKTTAQLERLLAMPDAPLAVALDVVGLLDPARRERVLGTTREKMSAALASGEDVVVFTSRGLVNGADAASSLEIGQRVSDALVSLLQGLTPAPRFLIAKGGITSSDLATRGLGVVRARVRGQILPGVPVWELGGETRFPGLNYVIFPGNVGDADALTLAFSKFTAPSASALP
jgi:uncharacterized protein YgbK (DUF1537 family)